MPTSYQIDIAKYPPDIRSTHLLEFLFQGSNLLENFWRQDILGKPQNVRTFKFLTHLVSVSQIKREEAE